MNSAKLFNYSFKEYKDKTVSVYIDGKFMCEVSNMKLAKKIFNNEPSEVPLDAHLVSSNS